VDSEDPRHVLAQYLRALREDRWPDRRITQLQLAQALGGVSVPLISSWESQTSPKIPPLSRLDRYAELFATPRSFDGDDRLRSEDMSDEESRAMAELKQDLHRLRSAALPAAVSPEPAPDEKPNASVYSGPWRFDDGQVITVVTAQWPTHMLEEIPYTDVDEPDYIELLTYSDLDALFELYGHLRAANPDNQVNLRTNDKLVPDDYTSHLATLGGLDWNTATRSLLDHLRLPVRQVADWEHDDQQYFEVTAGDKVVQHRPVLVKSEDKPDEKPVLLEDIALFVRAVNPFNRKRTVTICSGMYGRGTYGAVRALTDARFRDRNADHLANRFDGTGSYCILTRVPIVNGVTLTPDWTTGEYTLFEWSGM
jgi:transcriptional regulator with XRE-family HTH domain